MFTINLSYSSRPQGKEEAKAGGGGRRREQQRRLKKISTINSKLETNALRIYELKCVLYIGGTGMERHSFVKQNRPL
jgi:hypothetical protein